MKSTVAPERGGRFSFWGRVRSASLFGRAPSRDRWWPLPLTQKGLDSQLPSQTQPPGQPIIGEQIVLEYAADGAIAINHQSVALDQLESRLRAIYGVRHDKTLLISGAPLPPYGAIIGAIDAAKGAGVDRVGIITEGMRKR
ncbi:MAG: ExbD/TolR family protein [Vicinamibacterales bacterium]